MELIKELCEERNSNKTGISACAKDATFGHIGMHVSHKIGNKYTGEFRNGEILRNAGED